MGRQEALERLPRAVRAFLAALDGTYERDEATDWAECDEATAYQRTRQHLESCLSAIESAGHDRAGGGISPTLC
jgi:hypothetical protein